MSSHRTVVKGIAVLASVLACTSREPPTARVALAPTIPTLPVTTASASPAPPPTPTAPPATSASDTGGESVCKTAECRAALREAAEYGMTEMITNPDWPGPYFPDLTRYADAGLHRLAIRPLTLRSGRVDLLAMSNAVRTGGDRFNRCYDAGLRNNPELRGSVISEITVTPDRKVSTKDVGSDMADDGVTRCIVHVLRALPLPGAQDGRPAVVRVRIVFSP